jgi:hypothetical protein
MGFHLTYDGTLSAYKKSMKCKEKEYSETTISSTLNRGEVLLAYNLYYMTSISYVTAATSLDIKEYKEIQMPVPNAILPKMGINSSHQGVWCSAPSNMVDRVKTTWPRFRDSASFNI